MDVFLLTLFAIVCVFLVLVVLLQKGRGGGLGGAFGGLGSSAFGTRVGDVFTWVTIVLTALFLLLAVTTALVVRPPMQQVDKPFFNPPPGEYDKAQEVAIRTETENTKIYYTLDGSDPTRTEVLLYNDPVTVEPGTTIKARAYKEGYKKSVVAEGYYGPAEQPATQPATRPVTQPDVPVAGIPTTMPAAVPDEQN